MKYGYFDDQFKEYVITNPHTPTKWINYIGNLEFGGFIDQIGGSVICKGDPALNRITKYMPQLPDSSFNGETLYIGVNDEAVFSPYFVPTLTPYDHYKCRVGLGYSIYTNITNNIKTEITVFIPMGATTVIKMIKVTNLRATAVNLDITPVVEYTHFDALKQFTNADWVPQTMMSEAVLDEDYTVLTQYPFMHKGTAVNYLTSNVKIDSFETDRRVFLKDNQGGSWQKPLQLEEEHLTNYEARRGDSIGALLHKYTEVKPDETITVITQLGQYSNYEEELKQIQHFRCEDNVVKAFEDLKEFWTEYLSVLSVETPSSEMNSMLNIHNPKQCYMTKNWSRYLSLYQLGLGARGIGIRDTSQDIMGVIPFMPEEAKKLLETLWTMQRANGSAYHQYNPKTLIASEGDSGEEEDLPTYYGDDHLWIVLATCTYIKETGHTDLLDKVLPFYEKDIKGNSIESVTVREHIKRALNFTQTDVGQNGLPHLGFADWNDTVNLPTGAESLFNANLYGHAISEWIEIKTFLNEDINEEVAAYEKMKNSFNDIAWDGEWFIRYIDKHNQPLGSKKNEEGQIFTNGQSWSVISGFAKPDQGKQALESVYNILNTEYGIKLSYPGYNGYDPEKGGVSTYPPGAKENGGIFLHSNPWVMFAETLVGNGDRAFEYYNQINPVRRNDEVDRYELAPYVYPQNILGDEHPQFGLARNCWLSGTASWTYQIATQKILGIQPHIKGLTIDPCIPKSWGRFSATRIFRGTTYSINVENNDHVSKGVKSVYVDNELYDGLYLPNDKKTYTVRIVMGE